MWDRFLIAKSGTGLLPSVASSSSTLGTGNPLVDTVNFILDTAMSIKNLLMDTINPLMDAANFILNMGLLPSEAISSLLGKTIVPLGNTVKPLLETVMSIKNLLMDTGMSITNTVTSIILGKLILRRHILHSFFIRLLQEDEFILGVGSNDDATELWLHRCCV